MHTSGPMAGLAGSTQVRPGYLVDIGGLVIIDLRAGVMAPGAGVLIYCSLAPVLAVFPGLGLDYPHGRKNMPLVVGKLCYIKLFPEPTVHILYPVGMFFAVRAGRRDKE